MSVMNDISPNFKPNVLDAQIAAELLKHEGTPRAITRFAELHEHLTDYAYWFLLGTQWVSYSGWSDLNLWKRLFRSCRPKRASSIMKPSELIEFNKLPKWITAYRAHRLGETDWISYTLGREIAERFARERGVSEIVAYELQKKDCIALFLRRDEQEIIMLDPAKARRIEVLPLQAK